MTEDSFFVSLWLHLCPADFCLMAKVMFSGCEVSAGRYSGLGCLTNQITFLQKRANFGPVKGLKKSRKKQRNQNFTKESEKIVIRKLRYRKDSYSKTGVQKR
jgi:hypothetical protein